MLPRFAVALPQDALLQSSPPFDFPGVSMRVFPLRADLTRVQSLVDGWLNRALPPEIAYFRAFSPYVMLVALHYGRAAVIPSNLGWSSQKEVTFSIPLQWYRRSRRGFEFQDLAVLTPFIFVDNDLSIPAGREVFGWQKNLICMEPLADRWMLDPRAPTKHAGISTRAFREVYSGKQAQPLPFVTIDEAPPGAALQYPADRRSPLLPWVALSNAMDGALGLAQDMVDLLGGLGLVRPRSVPLRGGRTGWLDPGTSAAETLRTALRAADPRSGDLAGNEINLKQFRDAEHPTTACYQDVNNTVMRVQEINRAGLLGEARVLLGDLTGGYRITLHQWESLPVADMLGLAAARSTEVDGATVVSLRPVLPMWADVDLLYAGERRVIAWRSRDQPWTPGPGASPLERAPTSRRSGRAGERQSGHAGERVSTSRIAYNTTLGSSSPVVYGPFETPRATIRVLPLLASERRLAELCDRALNGPLRGLEAETGPAGEGGAGISFAPWGCHVYLVVGTADETYSVDNNIGSWPSRSARFVVPVRRFRDGAPDGFALYCPFAFAASTLESVSASEINGLTVMSAAIDSPSSAWLDEDGPLLARSRDLAVVRAMIPPILNAGERARTRTLLKVSQRGTDEFTAEEEELNPHWAPRIQRDLARRPAGQGGEGSGASFLDVARAHAIDILADQGRIPFVALKQFRDVARPDRACYQALVEVEQRLLHVERIEEITTPLEVTLFDLESMPIARMLGLAHRSSGYERGLRYRKLEPVRPFWIKAMVREELGRNLAEQRRDLAWVRRAPAAGEAEIAPDRVAAPGAWSDAERLSLLRRIDLGTPRSLAQLLTIERGKQPAAEAPPDSPPATPEKAASRPASPGADSLSADSEEPESSPAESLSAALEKAASTSSAGETAATTAGVDNVSSGDGAAEGGIGPVEPQWVIESLLSREWERRDNPVWLQRQREIERAAAEARGGVKALTEQAMSEIRELLSQRRAVAGTTHADVLAAIDGLLLPRFVALAWISAEARHLNELAFARGKAPGAEGPIAPPGGAPGAAPPFHEVLHFSDDAFADHGQYAGLEAEAEAEAEAGPAEAVPLYDQSRFDALESEEPDIVRRAEDVLTRDVAAGGLLRTLMDLCGDDAAGVMNEYSEHRPAAAPDTVAGSPADLFHHFAAEGGEESEGRGVGPDAAGLPEGLAGDLEKEATATLATARALVFLAWKKSAQDTGGKHAGWVAFVGEAAGHVDRARQELILALAKCWQKPFFCVRRDTAGAGAVADELFPLSECWIDREGVAWYRPRSG